MTKEDAKKESVTKHPHARSRTIIFYSVLIILGLLLLPIVQVLYVSFLNPHTTVPLIARGFGSVFSKNSKPRSPIIWKDAKEISPYFLRCLTAADEIDFFARMQARNIFTLDSSEKRGAITRQCVRELFVGKSRSAISEGLTSYYTMWMEFFLSRKRIFELYANVMELGEGVHGVEAAAQFYFERSAKKLSREQCGLLVASLPHPKAWTPSHISEEIRTAKNEIMERANLFASEEKPGVRHENKAVCSRCEQIVLTCSKGLQDWFHKERSLDPALHTSAGHRSEKSQEKMFASGRSKARFGESAHNLQPAAAIDVFFLAPDDTCIWDRDKLESIAARAAPAIEWGGHWTNLIDQPHFEEVSWRTNSAVQLTE